MKNIFKLLLLFAGLAFVATGCQKVGSLPYYSSGTASVLTSSVTTIAALPADSNKTAITFSWSSPAYATDSTTNKYIIEIDSSGRNFAKEYTKVVTGSLSAAFTNKEINLVVLGFGFAYNKPYDIDVRITSSYANNNNRLQSNVVKIRITPYVVPPKVVPPASKTLFLVGSATAGGWGNPVPERSQVFTRLDSVTYQGTFFLNGGQEYLALPVNGDWSRKFSVADKSLTGLSAGGNFGADLNDNFPAPAKTGFYKITFDFQAGKFTVVSTGTYGLLYVPGDYQGWNPATAAKLGSAKNDGDYEGYINFPAGGSFEFKFTTLPDWSNALGDAGAGTLSGSGGNIKVPGAGYYKINANTTANTWSATKTTWGLIGSFAGSGWGTDAAMTYDAGSNSWSATITLAAGDEFKFRANSDWGLNYGDTGADGSLEGGGDNIKGVAAGSHKITLYLNNSGYYTYKVE